MKSNSAVPSGSLVTCMKQPRSLCVSLVELSLLLEQAEGLRGQSKAHQSRLTELVGLDIGVSPGLHHRPASAHPTWKLKASWSMMPLRCYGCFTFETWTCSVDMPHGYAPWIDTLCGHRSKLWAIAVLCRNVLWTYSMAVLCRHTLWACFIGYGPWLYLFCGIVQKCKIP